jgi:uncharacterized protein
MAYTNRLINETSPYLLQHANNPVEWYPWGEEAFQRSRTENKPMLVSIGYSACHWCHVMERESFENVETANYMNEHFINIKVDREERPDIDHIYMDAVQAITGSGGWPLNVFLTPDKKPFYGGTYFPPARAYDRASWMDILEAITEGFRNKPDDIKLQANYIIEHLSQSNQLGTGNTSSPEHFFTRSVAENIYQAIMQQADKLEGGFGRAPKFPNTFVIQYLIRYHYYTKNQEALDQALLSLNRMIQGGIYDQLGGGFSRYATDNKWKIPHFEKMLYDNALLLIVLVEAYQLTHHPAFKETIVQMMAYIKREMTSPEGGFYAAQDADSEGEEGKYYVWEYDEIRNCLTDETDTFCEFFHVQPGGNWEGKNILYRSEYLEEFAEKKQIEKTVLQHKLAGSIKKMLQERSKRSKPSLDDKIILGWNAIMIVACCQVYSAFGIVEYRQMAERSILFLLEKMQKHEGLCWHVYKNGVAKYPAFLDDYAFLIQAFVSLQEITGNQDYLLLAKKFTDTVIENFYDKEDGYFFYTSAGQADIIIRKKEMYDGAVPSGNAAMAINLHHLGIFFGNTEYREMSEKMVNGLASSIERYPVSFGFWANVLLELTAGTTEIAIVGKLAMEKALEVNAAYIPWKVLQASTIANDMFPLLQRKTGLTQTFLYFCKNYTCQEPVTEVNALLQKIAGFY